MASVTLTKVWINRYDTGEAVSAQSSGRAQGYEVAGEIRTYAGGRQRSITEEGERGQFALILRSLTLATVNTLRAWQGVTVQVRDHRGQRWFGVYHAVSIDEVKDPALYDVALAVRVVSADEGM